jgi:hypothetical protein
MYIEKNSKNANPINFSFKIKQALRVSPTEEEDVCNTFLFFKIASLATHDRYLNEKLEIKSFLN